MKDYTKTVPKYGTIVQSDGTIRQYNQIASYQPKTRQKPYQSMVQLCNLMVQSDSTIRLLHTN